MRGKTIMSPKLDETLVKDFPLLYHGRHKSKFESCMGWGFSCDDGWYPLIRRLSEKLEKIIQELPESDRFEAAQVKEKFGWLRFYISRSTKETEKIRAIIGEAEVESSKTCEQCGNPGSLNNSIDCGWIKTLCSPCATKLGYEQVNG